MTQRRLEALLGVVSRGIDELEDELEYTDKKEAKEIDDQIIDAQAGYLYLVEWLEQMKTPKVKKGSPSKQEMTRVALDRIDVILASKKIREIVNS